MRIFSIADIHGEADKLASLLVLLKKHNGLDLTKDKLVFTGDYIDRGKDSYKVLALIYELQKEFPNNIVALAGNHEWIMIDYHLYKYDGGLWHANGGKATEKSFYKHHGSKKCPGHSEHYIFGDAGCGCSKDAPLCAINVHTRDVIYSI